LQNAAAKSRGRFASAVDGTDEGVHQLVDVVRATIGHISLGQRPDAFVRIEFRRIRREVLDMETGMPTLEFRQRFSVVSCRIVEDGDHWTPQVSKKIAEEHAHLLANVVEVKLVEKAQMLALRTDRDSRDDGDFVPSVVMPMHRGVAPRCPGLDHIRDQQEPGFVGKDDVGTQPRSVFFTRGQSFRFQRSIASSSRSTARFTGFW